MAAILVIDDDEIIRELVHLVLSQAGHAVLAAADGQAGLDLTRHTRVNLVLLDIDMPGMSGIPTLKALRVRHGAVLPVMMMTARDDADTVRQAVAAGATGYIVKPFEPASLLQRVQALLGRRPPENTHVLV